MPKGELIKFVSILDTTANDSNKTIISGLQHDAQLMHLHVAYTTTATVGNRLLELNIQDNGNSIGHIHPGSVQAENLTYHYYFLPGIFRETVSAVAETGVDGTIEVPIPMETIIPKGGSLIIKDTEAVAAAADDMVVRGMYKLLR